MAETDKFNPQHFAKMATDPDFFRGKLPQIVKKTFEERQLKLGSGPENQVTGLAKQIYIGVATLWNDGSKLMRWKVYRHWARERGLLDARGCPPVEAPLKRPKSIRVLSSQQVGEWAGFLEAGEITRGVALDAFAVGVLAPLWLPPIKIKDPVEVRSHPQANPDPELVRINNETIKLCLELGRVPYQMVLRTFPDLTDQDVRVLFGRINTLSKVEDVRRRAKR